MLLSPESFEPELRRAARLRCPIEAVKAPCSLAPSLSTQNTNAHLALLDQVSVVDTGCLLAGSVVITPGPDVSSTSSIAQILRFDNSLAIFECTSV